MGKRFDTYIHRLAKTIVGQTGMKFEKFDYVSTQKLGGDIYSEHGSGITIRLRSMSLATRAKIGAQGKALHTTGGVSLEGVHCRSNWLNGSLSGEDIITLVATTAIIAAICDLMMEDRFQRGTGGLKAGPGDMTFGFGGPIPASPARLPSLDAYDRNLN